MPNLHEKLVEHFLVVDGLLSDGLLADVGFKILAFARHLRRRWTVFGREFSWKIDIFFKQIRPLVVTTFFSFLRTISQKRR